MNAWLKHRSIRTRLFGIIGALSLLAIVSFGGIALVVERNAAHRAIASEQVALATLMANRSAAALLSGNPSLAKESFDALGGIPHIQAACLYDKDGRLFAAFTVPAAPPCAERRGTVPINAAESLEVEVEIKLDEAVGSLTIRSCLRPMRNRLREQAQTLAVVSTVSVLLALVLAAMLERLITSPIRRVSAVVESIDASDTHGQRAPVEGEDEVSQLAEAFNRMLDRLDEQTRGLKLQAEYNEVLFKRSPLPVIVADPRANGMVDCNEAAVAIYGFGSREATLNITAASVSAPQQYDGTPSEIAIVPYITAALAGVPQVYDWRHRRPDGSEFDAEVHLTRFGPEDAPMLLASLFDVTERKQTAAALQRMNEVLENRVAERTRDLAASNAELSAAVEKLHRIQEELVRRERLASLGSLVAGVAHELNTPLGNVLLVATALSDDMEELHRQLDGGELRRSSLASFLDQQAEAQALIVRNARRAVELIGHFKQVAVDQTSEQRRRFDLAEVVDEVLGTLHPRRRMTPHRLRVEMPAGLDIDSYPGLLGQVLTNLVMNAMIHGLGERPGEVCVRARALDGDQVELCIQDDGVGIPPEHLPRIFDPFFTTKLGEGGSGLGLHIVYSLVERGLGGRISVESTPGAGSRFVVTLPRVAPQPETD